MSRRRRRSWRITRDWLITCVALVLLVYEGLTEARPAVLVIYMGMAVGPHALRMDRGERDGRVDERREVERDGAD